MTITLIETKPDGDHLVCVWADEAGQQFLVSQFETAVSDVDDFKDLYAHRAGFKSLSDAEMGDLYDAIETIEDANPTNARGKAGKAALKASLGN